MTPEERRTQALRDIGWLEGFGEALWVRADIKGVPSVPPETCAVFCNTVDRLREYVTGVPLPDGESH